MHRLVDSRNRERLKGATFSLFWVGDSDLVTKITKSIMLCICQSVTTAVKKNPKLPIDNYELLLLVLRNSELCLRC